MNYFETIQGIKPWTERFLFIMALDKALIWIFEAIESVKTSKNVVQVLYISAHEDIHALLGPVYAHILTAYSLHNGFLFLANSLDI